jgi:solute carrier family 45 protein 1/2/4
MGVMSDRCESKFGRRRPFLLALSIMALVGISLILNGSLIGTVFGDLKREVNFSFFFKQ